jgi:hypothetical protein
MDLNIDHYSLHDLLRLFKLPENFTSRQLKEARKYVVEVHPDKSGLDKSYFIFFHKAYSLLNTVHSFKQKAHANMSENQSFSDILDGMEDTDKRMLATTFTTNPKFNKEFNELFETLYVKDNDGHGDWLKSNDDLDVSYESRKQQSRAITISSIEASNAVHYADLKSVYTIDSVIGVSEDDYKSGYTTVQELKTARAQTIAPLNREEAERIILHDQARESKEATERAFRLLQEEEANQRQQQTFWSKLLTLNV